MAERKYNGQEITDIFERAAQEQEAARRSRPADEGLTLSELQKIGKESGITPEFIARAAAAIEGGERNAIVEKVLGFPFVVSQTVPIAKPLTDDEWARFVVELRDMFGKDGQMGGSGALRQWTDKEVTVNVEPFGGGHRVRMGTAPAKKGVAKLGIGISIAVFLVSLIPWSIVLFGGVHEPSVYMPAIVFTLLSIMPLLGLRGSSNWARKKEQQFASLVSKLNQEYGVSSAVAEKVDNRVVEAQPQIVLDNEAAADVERDQTNQQNRLRS